jgi:hypothetical protein
VVVVLSDTLAVMLSSFDLQQSRWPVQETSRAGKDAGGVASEEELLISGLKTYFNRSCRLLLLYPQERLAAETVRDCAPDM